MAGVDATSVRVTTTSSARRLDEERAVSAALRQQLKSSTGTQQHLAQQLRALQGAPGVPVATRDGNRSVPQLERQISKLQDQLDDATVHFVTADDGRGDGLAAIEMLAIDRARAGTRHTIGGLHFDLV